jgi:GNAT superfamily N-acetyltransferase
VLNGQSFEIRAVSPDDAALIALHRRLMFEELGHSDQVKLHLMENQFRTWVQDKLAYQEYFGWFVIDEANIERAGAGLWIRESIINPNDLSGKEGYIGNVYTQLGYRRRGFARALMQVVLDWCQAHAITGFFLRPSEEARSLYLTLGFEADNVLYRRLKSSPELQFFQNTATVNRVKLI